jgi:hypothetical protein
MKFIEVEDFVYEEFEQIRKELGVYGTRPPGIPFGYDDTAVVQRLISRYKFGKEVIALARHYG